MPRIATWNINSIRARQQGLTDLILRHDLDIIALQETKVKDEQFPDFPELADKGYTWAHVGYNQWNGVAIFSRVGLDCIRDHFPGQPGYNKDPEATQAIEARALGARCGGIDIWSLYVPNGRSLQDRHYTYKLAWLEKLREAYSAGQLSSTGDPTSPQILMGDFNIAPRDGDVWPTYAGETHVSEPERKAFAALEQAGLKETTRALFDDYTYWDYMRGRYPRNHGMRIDFQLASPGLEATSGYVDREERARKGSSDHAAVIVDYKDI